MRCCCKPTPVPLGGFPPHTSLWPGKQQQQLFSRHSKPYGSCLPPAAFPVTAAPRVLAHVSWLGGSLSTSRSFLFSTHLLQGLSLLVLLKLEANHRLGQRQAPARGHAHAANQGCSFAPRCPRLPPLLHPRFRHTAPGSRNSAAGSSDCQDHLQAQVCPSGSALRSTRHPQSKALGTGMLVRGQEMSTPLWEDKHRARVLQRFHQSSRGKKRGFMQLRNFSSTHHRCCSSPCLCILT